jgi:hypothetical protein
MIRARFQYIILMVSLCLLLASTQQVRAVTVDDYLYQPSAEFLDSFFLTFAEGAYKYPEAEDSSLILRRLYSFDESIGKLDFVSAWQTLVNLPEHPDYPAISDIKTDALAIQSVIPWMNDKQLRQNFLSCYDEIWLKSNGIDQDYEKFRTVFGGYASRADGKHPATFMRDHLSYYGYNRQPDQPSEDMEFLFDLFRSFSIYTQTANSFGSDFRTADPSEFSKIYMQRVAERINSAWNTAVAEERVRTGDSSFLEAGTPSVLTSIEDIQPVEVTEIEEPGKIDYDKINIFKLPEGVEPIHQTTEFVEVPIQPAEEIETPVDEAVNLDSEVVVPLKDGGLEPPEPVVEIPNVEVEEIPIADKQEPDVEKTSDNTSVFEKPVEEKPVDETELDVTNLQPVESETEKVSTEPKPEVVTIPETFKLQPEVVEPEPVVEEEKPEAVQEEVESVFVTPEVIIVDVQKDDTEEETVDEPVVEIPSVDKVKTVEPVKTEVPVKVEEPVKTETIEEPTEEVNLLDNTKPSETIKTEPDKTEPDKTEPAEPEPVVVELEKVEPVKVEPVKIEPVIPEPVKVEPVDPKIKEQADIANKLTDRTLVVADKLGRYAVDLVLLWSKEPDSDPKYAEKETELEDNFRVNKEEFLALLYINDAFRLETDLGTTFDELNGRVIDALMKGYTEFKNSGGLTENPNVSDEELLRAIGQLTTGVETRRDSMKIQNASLKAFRLRQSQYKTEIARLEQLKKIEIGK